MNARFFARSIALSVLPLLFAPALGRSQESTTVGGYGELHYNEPNGIERGKLDFHRFILYLSHEFNEEISFKSELELEHTRLEAGDDAGGEIALEQAYIDWRLKPSFGLRAGILLLPVAIINQIHEPPTFNGVERPNVDRYIIPTTWRESGAGVYGTISEGVNYQFYVMAGLRAEGFSGSSGIRGGRQEALESSPANPSFTGRLDYTPTPDLKLGGSFYIGNTTQGEEGLGSGLFRLISGDVRYSYENLSLRAVGALEYLNNADKINATYGKGVGDESYGYYIEGAYDAMPLLRCESEQTLSPFVRYEKYNMHSRVTGFPPDPLLDRNDVTVGATYKPTYNTVVKCDYQFFNNAADANTKQLNVGIGYNF